MAFIYLGKNRMSATYYLVNSSKKEILYFTNLPVSMIGEIMMNHIASAMVVWYLSKSKGDTIYFINDYDNDDLLLYNDYMEVSDKVIDEMIMAGYLAELEPKKLWFDDEIWFRNLVIRCDDTIPK